MSINTEEKEVIHSMYTKTTFVKIKQSLEIGKILLSFVDMNTKKNIDCYMQAEEFGALLMQDIKNGSLFKKIVAEKAKGEQYPKEIWSSPVGGSKKDGNIVSRHFTISPGSQAEVLFTGIQYPATQNETGAFIPIKGSKPFVIRVACSFNDLRLIQYKWSFLEQDYMAKKYSLSAMKSEYNREGNLERNEQTFDNNLFTVNIKDEGRTVSNGMKVFTIAIGDTIGKLYVRPEDFDKITDKGLIKIKAEKKGNDYLLLSS